VRRRVGIFVTGVVIALAAGNGAAARSVDPTRCAGTGSPAGDSGAGSNLTDF